jgi:hypothetical protein
MDPRMNRGIRPLAAALLLILAVGLAAAPSPVETVPAAGTYVVTSDKVNVRASPDVDAGKVVGKLNKGDRVVVTEITVLAFDVQGMRAAWFHVTKPDGWVFGYYLDPAE